MFTKPYSLYCKSFKIKKDRIRELGVKNWRGMEVGVHKWGCIGRGTQGGVYSLIN